MVREIMKMDGEDQFSGPLGCIKKYLVGNMEVEYEKTNNSLSYNSIELNNCPDSNSKFASKDNGIQGEEDTIAAFTDIVQFWKQEIINEKPVEKDANNERNALRSSSKEVDDPLVLSTRKESHI